MRLHAFLLTLGVFLFLSQQGPLAAQGSSWWCKSPPQKRECLGLKTKMGGMGHICSRGEEKGAPSWHSRLASWMLEARSVC
jgi:hypothetical protein